MHKNFAVLNISILKFLCMILMVTNASETEKNNSQFCGNFENEEFIQHCCINNVNNQTRNFSYYRENLHEPSIFSTVNISCLPSFIIAGTQKSGTTVLSALLSNHKRVSFAPKKEVHFFDRNKAYIKGKFNYLQYFKAWNISNFPSSPPIYGEATPFYVASKYSCKRIAKMIPNVKIIILLREPISRAYSEFHMKKRRVDTQNDFISEMFKNQEYVYDCMIKCRNKWKKLARCFPNKISSHDHFDKFISSIKSIFKKGVGGWASVMSKCFSRMPESQLIYMKTKKYMLQIKNHNKNSNFLNHIEYSMPEFSTLIVPEGLKSIKYRNEYFSENKLKRISEYYSFLNESKSSPNPNPDDQYAYIDDHYYTNIEFENIALSMGLSSNLNLSSTEPVHRRSGHFQPIGCLGKYASEKITSVQTQFLREIYDIESCSINILKKIRMGSNKFCFNQHDNFCTDHSLNRSNTNPLHHITHNEAQSVINKCINITAGISDQFVYRSLYAPQISNCMSFIPESSFLILPSESLKSNPAKLLRIVLKFIGFSDEKDLSVDQILNMSQSPLDFVNQSVSNHFPRFEKATGWQLKSQYPEMPRTITNRFQNLINPFNQALFSFIRNNFSDLWKID